mmetsp:Transcript_102686/g.267992  ORF Transcript_102686/g.267992 Transcript_102686/m.267992 type:complete len:360 (-) Transcript_102686:201-1280(-)
MENSLSCRLATCCRVSFASAASADVSFSWRAPICPRWSLLSSARAASSAPSRCFTSATTAADVEAASTACCSTRPSRPRLEDKDSSTSAKRWCSPCSSRCSRRCSAVACASASSPRRASTSRARCSRRAPSDSNACSCSARPCSSCRSCSAPWGSGRRACSQRRSASSACCRASARSLPASACRSERTSSAARCAWRQSLVSLSSRSCTESTCPRTAEDMSCRSRARAPSICLLPRSCTCCSSCRRSACAWPSLRALASDSSRVSCTPAWSSRMSAPRASCACLAAAAALPSASARWPSASSLSERPRHRSSNFPSSRFSVSPGRGPGPSGRAAGARGGAPCSSRYVATAVPTLASTTW